MSLPPVESSPVHPLEELGFSTSQIQALASVHQAREAQTITLVARVGGAVSLANTDGEYSANCGGGT